MKSRFALLALLVVAVSPLAAQRGGRGFGPQGILNYDQMNALLKLSSPQKTAYQAALTTYNKVVQPLQQYTRDQRQAGAVVSPDSTKKQQDVFDSFKMSIDSILTDVQKPKFDSVAAATGRGARGF